MRHVSRRTESYEGAKTKAPDINETTAVAAAAGVRANTRHFDELPLAMRHTRSGIDPRLPCGRADRRSAPT